MNVGNTLDAANLRKFQPPRENLNMNNRVLGQS